MKVRFDVEDVIRRILRASALPLASTAIIACGSPSAATDAGVDSGQSCNASCCGFVAETFYVLPDGGALDGGIVDGWSTCDSPPADGGNIRCRTFCVGRVSMDAAFQSTAPHDVATYLARMAEGEELSVLAFLGLERELRHHALPRTLLRRVRACIRDEVQHARMVRNYAGLTSRVRLPAFSPNTPRPVFEVAVENVVEGCVGEGFGALVGAHQARNAENAGFRELMTSIATDEARHAQLAFDVHAELVPRLSIGERAAIKESAGRAVQQLIASASVAREDPELALPGALDLRRFATDFARATAPVFAI